MARSEGQRAVTTFDDFFKEHRLTEAERRELVYFLAMLRFRNTIDRLLPQSPLTPGALDDPA